MQIKYKILSTKLQYNFNTMKNPKEVEHLKSYNEIDNKKEIPNKNWTLLNSRVWKIIDRHRKHQHIYFLVGT